MIWGVGYHYFKHGIRSTLPSLFEVVPLLARYMMISEVALGKTLEAILAYYSYVKWFRLHLDVAYVGGESHPEDAGEMVFWAEHHPAFRALIDEYFSPEMLEMLRIELEKRMKEIYSTWPTKKQRARATEAGFQPQTRGPPPAPTYPTAPTLVRGHHPHDREKVQQCWIMAYPIHRNHQPPMEWMTAVHDLRSKDGKCIIKQGCVRAVMDTVVPKLMGVSPEEVAQSVYLLDVFPALIHIVTDTKLFVRDGASNIITNELKCKQIIQIFSKVLVAMGKHFDEYVVRLFDLIKKRIPQCEVCFQLCP
jgi:hypothetical protein